MLEKVCRNFDVETYSLESKCVNKGTKTIKWIIKRQIVLAKSEARHIYNTSYNT